ncbi:fimbrillin family protein [Parasphaerochaeta coccoides]|uniref:Regulator of chromosome condensation RCC1 n=1 Tax=Parasphaerochaeta coccoides (strain ATCC BAA-1237 / DSM 17374 / SPN1) TaxID=760011 RepID=F4GIV8_PARC1|nr:fimbrillin family protein [Parasphaerochaeta coccoides]AEC02726.1 regulator of chromosome condensation RCC1 [Parasphaerochaeta coccoides DSM 17374]
MRKNGIVLASLLMVLFVFASCNGNLCVSHANDVRFTTEIIGRKATADSGWSIGDEVGIYMVKAGGDVATVAATDRDNVQYVADTAGINFSGFSPVNASNPLKWDDISTPAITYFDFIAYYPYESPIADTTALPINVYPGSGEQDTGKADFLWGKKAGVQNNTSTVCLTLSHALSRLVVNVIPSTTVDKDAINGGTLVATVTGLNTQATINLDTGDVTPVIPSDIDIVMKDISGTLTDAERTAGNRRFEAVLIPVDNTFALDNVSLEFTLTDGSGTHTYTWAATSVATSDQGKIHFDAGKQHVYNMTLNTKTDEVAIAEIRIGIVDWDTGSGVNGAAEKAYSLTFGDNGATRGSAPGRMHAHGGSQVTLPGSGTLERDSHDFYGWNTLPDGNGSHYAASESFTMPADDVTLYAQWKVMVKVKSVSAGGFHTLILKMDGTLWATGNNEYGQLGVGTSGTVNSKSTPVQVMTDVAAVSAGWSHTMILKNDGTLWATGRNKVGQLGVGDNTNRSTPVQVSSMGSDVAAVSTGESYTMIVKKDGTLWATGQNTAGQLGDGTTDDRNKPVQVKGLNGVGFMTDVEDVFAGGFHTMILKKNGTLWATGFNYFGQLCDGTTTIRTTPVQVQDSSGVGFMTDVATVSAGWAHTMILKKDGTLWAIGKNEQGQLGVSDKINRSTPAQVSSNVASVSAGESYTMILKKDGTLWATGSNDSGRLGVGDNNDRSSPMQVSSMGSDVAAVSAGFHTMILKKNGTLWATGYNFLGQLGLGDSGSGTDRSTPEQVVF